MIIKETIKLFGVAGAGKTTECLNYIKRFINEGYNINDICFTTYTRAGIKSMLEKLNESNISFNKKELNFRTLNSLTWKLSSFDREMELNEEDCISFFKTLGVKTKNNDETKRSEMEEVLACYNALLNTIGKSYSNLTIIEKKGFILSYLEEKEIIELEFKNLIYYMDEYEKWKIKNNKKDYVDSIIYSIENKKNISEKILIVDEAQDLGNAMAMLINIWTKDYERDYFVISGDDDQTVHEWAGATPKFLIEYNNDNMKEDKLLEESYRLPCNTANLCNDILRLIEYRKKKTIFSKKPNGKIQYLMDVNDYNISKYIKEIIKNTKDCYILFRTNKILRQISDILFEEIEEPFGSISSDINTKWSLKFILISNALNKIKQNINLTKTELSYLFDVLPSSECLIYGAKTKIEQLNIADSITIEDFLKMTKLWSPQSTLINIQSNINIKDKIIQYINYSGKKEEKKEDIDRNRLYKNKFRKITKIYEFEINEKGKPFINYILKLGTFHSSKGLQAETIIVFLGTSLKFNNINDSEKRCFYVACSRSIKDLYFISSYNFNNLLHKPYLENYFNKIINRHITSKHQEKAENKNLHIKSINDIEMEVMFFCEVIKTYEEIELAYPNYPIESILQTLLKRGDLFEPKSGNYQML